MADREAGYPKARQIAGQIVDKKETALHGGVAGSVLVTFSASRSAPERKATLRVKGPPISL